MSFRSRKSGLRSVGHWWVMMSSNEDVNAMTWERFKELFCNKYFTAPVRAVKMNKFIQLRQGGMTGLRPELYRDVSMDRIQGISYFQIAEKALVAEQGQSQKSKFQSRQGQQQWDQGKRPKIDQEKASTAQLACPKCGGQHTGGCPTETRTYYVCEKVGHFARACLGNPNPMEQKKVLVRVFTITRLDVDTNPSVVIGNFSIFGIPTLVLFDSGATHSFVSTEYVRRLGRTPNVQEINYSVIVPSGDVQQTNLILRACVILIENQ
ncbi:uncharacterized protein LOC111374091 [Olea europaea var. sylvestris]|uniref:uncharacterized protein LOC111374091 n=1 Tax=Olea europaea var. sylvestris TaxID=158386 RepID=UPI000C1CF74F|nr:uncharacterized protein LOC111374091 [Olea europaea var. sylvestris]